MRLTLEFLPTHSSTPLDTVVVIDVLRMTTTACVLFSQGLSELAVVAAVDDARVLAAAEGALLLGERGGVKLPGFHGGNSPLEYLNQDLSAQRAVLCTSNGSSAVEAAAGASHLFLGSLVNAAAVAAAALSAAQAELRLVCAGTDGESSLDDVLGAACIAREVARLEPAVMKSDSVNLALKALSSTPDLAAGLLEARHGALLHSLGFGEDVRFAARLNSFEKVPRRVSQGPARFTS